MIITSPIQGATVKGIVPVLVDAPGVKRVNFFIDGVKKGSDPGPPFKFSWYTTNYPDGQHTITAKSGNGTQSADPVTVTVANGVVPPPPPPPPSGYPASFFTGPLGANNMLPPAGKKFLCSMIGGIGIYPDEALRRIAARQAAMGRKYSVIQGHYGGDQYWDGVYGAPPPTWFEPTPWEKRTFDNGSLCAMAWTPDYTIQDVLAGKADQIHAKMGAYWATYKPKIIINRLFHEFDLPGMAWGYGGRSGKYTPAEFRAAFKRQVDNIRNAGGTNVGFWWCPFEGGYFGVTGDISRKMLVDYYPGDDLVDWVSSDCYNVVNAQSSPLHAGFAEWWEIFNYGAANPAYLSNYDQFSKGTGAATKPFMVGETSSTYTTRKPDWFRNITNHPNGIKSMPNCIGISFFDVDVHSPSDYDWRVDSNASVPNVVGQSDPATLAGFVAMAQDPIWA